MGQIGHIISYETHVTHMTNLTYLTIINEPLPG
jgi:hypothetical protein